MNNQIYSLDRNLVSTRRPLDKTVKEDENSFESLSQPIYQSTLFVNHKQFLSYHLEVSFSV